MSVYEELKELKNKLDEIEKKYSFMYDYKLISAILDKLNVKEMKLSREEIENNNSMYVVINAHCNTVTVKKEDE